MSRAQGDGFRTHTDHELNAYKWRLQAKVAKLTDYKEKWYHVGNDSKNGWILAAEYNRMENPNGSWKWNGWIIDAHVYDIRVFPAECVEINDGKPHVIGWSQVVKTIDDDKEAANRYFKDIAIRLAKDLRTWIPSEVDNKPAFDYEGRIPSAAIVINWDEVREAYDFSLIVDGEEVMRSKDRKELEQEAERRGAELTETHTP